MYVCLLSLSFLLGMFLVSDEREGVLVSAFVMPKETYDIAKETYDIAKETYYITEETHCMANEI